MKRKWMLILPIVLLVGCTQQVPINKENNNLKNTETKVETKSEDNKVKEKREENKKTEVKKENTEQKSEKHLDDEKIKNIINRMLADGFSKRDEDVKTDDTWVSVSKYTKDIDKGKYIVFINKTDDSSKIHNLEDTQGYAGREMIETNDPNIKAFKNTDERFTMFVVYDEKEKNGIIFMVNGSPKSKEVNEAMGYIKNLLKDVM